MAQSTQFSFDSVVFPLSSTPSTGILQEADPVLYRLCQYYSNILQLNLGSRWSYECSAVGLVGTNNLKDGYIVGDTIPYPVPSLLQTDDFKFPLLSITRTRSEFEQYTTNRILQNSEFSITWTLPPLTSQQKRRLYPFIESAIPKTLVFYTFEGNDPKYNNGEMVFTEAGLAFLNFNSCELGSFLGQDGKTEFPSIKISMTVAERNQFVPGNYEALTGFDTTVLNADGYMPQDPIQILQQSFGDDLVLSSVTPARGPATGGTTIVLLGSNLYNIASVTVCGVPVAGFDPGITGRSIVAITGISSTTGSGDIVVTNQQGLSVTLSGAFTYH